MTSFKVNAAIFLLLGISLQIANGQTLYPVAWTDAVNVTVNANTSLTRINGTGWTGGAASFNRIKPAQSGFAQFTISSLTANYMIGLSRSNPAPDYQTIEYAMYVNNSSLQAYESGAPQGLLSSLVIGDVLKISLEGDSVKWYRNNVALRKIKIVRTVLDDFIIDVSISSAVTIPTITASFDKQIVISGTVTPVNGGGTGGGITVTPSGGSGSYTYSWSTGESTAAIANKTPGQYKITVSDSEGRVSSKVFSIGYLSNWIELTGVTVNANNQLTKSTPSAWDGGAASSNKIAHGSTGWLEFTYTPTGAAYDFGLSRGNFGNNYTYIEFGYMVNGSGTVSIYETAANIGVVSRPQPGDVFRISLENDSIKYYKNNLILRKRPATANPAGTWIVDASVFTQGIAVPPVLVSSDASVAIAETITPVNFANSGGKIELVVSGGKAPYSYAWNSGEATSSIQNKSVGTYSVNVTDAEGRTASRSYSLGYKVVWTDVQPKLRVNSDNTLSNPVSGYEGAACVNTLPPNTDGWVEFVTGQPDAGWYAIGLSQINISGGHGSISYAFSTITNTNMYVYEGSANQLQVGALRSGDVYRIGREGAFIKYYKNGTLIRSTAVASDIPLIVDVTLYSGKTPQLSTSFGSTPVLYSTMQPVDANGNNGGLQLTIKGGTAPYQVAWSSGETGAIISGKSCGMYTATVTDADGQSVSRSFTVGPAITWTNLQNTARDPNFVLRKTTGANLWNAGAFSKNYVEVNQDGGIEFQLTTAYVIHEIGLSDLDVDKLTTSIDYGFYINLQNQIMVYEAGVNKQTIGYATLGDVFNIHRVGNQIKYFKNGVEVRSVATNANQRLYADVSIYSLGSISPIVGSFTVQVGNSIQQIANNLAFQYRYDDRNRMIAKKVPGAEWVYTVYDNRDRVVLTQDGNQRLTNEWTFMKYDALNRPVLTGTYKHQGSEITQSELQGLVNQHTASPDKYYEDFVGTGSDHGYTNRSYPTQNLNYLTVTYYDKYDFKSLINDGRFDYLAGEIAGQDAAASLQVISQVTGTKVRLLADNVWMRSVKYYDSKHRLIQSVDENHLGRVNRSTSKYDFTGKVLETKTKENQAYPITWVSIVNAEIDGQKLKAFNNNNAWASAALSAQQLAASQDGWVETVIDNVTDLRMFGFSDADAGANYNTIDYAFYFVGPRALIYELGVFRNTYVDIQIGDVLRVERIGGVVYYKQNGQLIYQSTVSSATILTADVSIYTNGHTLNNCRASFGMNPLIQNTVQWATTTGVTFNGPKVSKTSTTTSWPSGYAATVNQLVGPGYIQFSAIETDLARMAGLSSKVPATNFDQFDYGVYLMSNGQYRIMEGTNVLLTASYATGDVFRIESDGSTIRYLRNNSIVSTSAVQPSKSYRALLGMYSANSTIDNFAISFGIPFVEQRLDQYQRFEYDHAGRLLRTWHGINNDPEILLSTNEYNELGQLVDKHLHSVQPASTPASQRIFKQSVDYRYNIRGWLTSINNSTLTQDTQSNIDNNTSVGDLFGMNLAYNETLPGVTTALNAQHNGNISGLSYSNFLGAATTKVRGYRYSYDAMNRLTDADHFTKTTTWISTPAFAERIGQYDLNGNIMSITRTDATGAVMDQLSYFYGSSLTYTNALNTVTDNGNDTKGFIDGTQTGVDYAYDANGNMIADLNKDIRSISYNFLNLPERVGKLNGESIQYIYDATGRKMAQLVFGSNNRMKKRSDYTGSLFLENDTLKFVSTGEGRVIPQSFTGTVNEYQYNLKDHLGNVRLTFTTKDESTAGIATLETAQQSTERSQFLRYDNARRVKSKIFDKTNGNADGYAVRLSGRADEVYGLAKSLSVMPGDIINMEVYAKYVDAFAPNTPELTDFINSIVNLTAPAGVVVDGGAYGSSTSSFNYAGFLNNSNAPGAPKAYLNWLVFDRDHIFKDGGYVAITTDAKETGTDVLHQRLAKDNLLIKEPGYVYIYLSNENETPVEVFFDDFRVEHVKGPVIQINDYYPFGLTYNSYSRENSAPQDYKFNGKEEQDELDLGVLDYGARFYDPSYGRWWGQDPFADLYHRHSPYSFSLNDPVNVIDPDGMMAFGINDDGPHYIASTFVGPDGKVIKHIDDDDHKVYYVDDPSTWDGESKDGLEVIGFEDPSKTYKPGDNYEYYNPREDPNFDWSYMIPAEAYDYTDEEDMKAKHDDDDAYIRHATHSDSYLWRLEKIIWRDLTADENRETVTEAALDATRVGRISQKLGLHKKKKQSTGSLKGAKEQKHSKGIKRIKQKYNDKKRKNDNWHQNPNKK